MTNPNVCVLKTDGINCDMEMAYAFEVAGGRPETVHINQLREGDRSLSDFGALAIPGGFSYGDDVASGRILANELTSYLSDQLQAFVDEEKPIIGVCNGFQVLVKTGLLPARTLGVQEASLVDNDSARFVCRWFDLAVGETVCKFIQPEDTDGLTIPMQVAHGEGKFLAPDSEIQKLKENGQVVFRYAPQDGRAQSDHPYNPNGSIDDIAGICDETGLILGMMPHPERSIEAFHPDRSRTALAREMATTLFKNVMLFVNEN